MRRLAVGLLLAALSLGCSSEQDPGLTPSTDGGPPTTSQTLRPCPPAGPDATTPPAGCLDEDGAVVRP